MKKVFMLVVWILIVPILVGSIAAERTDGYKKNVIFMWVAGQILLWALFQLVCVPFVLAGAELTNVILAYCPLCLILAAVAIFSLAVRIRKKTLGVFSLKGSVEKRQPSYYFFWIVFFGLLIFQMIQAVRMMYTDGDDAYYVAIATLAEENGTMYSVLPYTGGNTELDFRHGLAPFPIWIAFLAKLSGIRAVSVAHVAMPLMMIPMAYAIFYLIGNRLCGEKGERLPFFLVMSELLVLFGDSSLYTTERFLIVRSRQGKAALGSIIIPMLFFLMMLLLDRIQEGQKMEWMIWLLLAAAATASCLCSTQGAELVCLLAGSVGFCAAICYRRWKLLLPMVLCCVPAAFYALLYFCLRD